MAWDHHSWWGLRKDRCHGSFRPYLNWKLKQRSHTFRGQDGGTCINEAAIVAAGFPYQPVRAVVDMPACFSRPICRLAMQLNDEASDEEQQHLLPFVTRLACADTSMVEREREAYIAARMRWRLPFRDGLTVLEGALAIGRQADALSAEEAQTRMEGVQQNAPGPTSETDHALFAKVQGWLIGIF